MEFQNKFINGGERYYHREKRILQVGKHEMFREVQRHKCAQRTGRVGVSGGEYLGGRVGADMTAFSAMTFNAMCREFFFTLFYEKFAFI